MADFTWPELYTAIMVGDFDDHKDDIVHALRERGKLIGQKNAMTMGVGSRVVTCNLSPRYLNGLHGEISEVVKPRNGRGKGSFRIKLDVPFFEHGRQQETVLVSPVCVEAE